MSTFSKDQKILVIIQDTQINYLLERVLQSAGYLVKTVPNEETAMEYLQSSSPALIMIGETLGSSSGIEIASYINEQYPAFPILILVQNDSPELLRAAVHAGITDYLSFPLKSDTILNTVENIIKKNQKSRTWVLLEANRTADRLQRRVDELETLARVSQTVTSSLNSDAVLTAIVEAAVLLTEAEEGNLLLLDEASGELYMRAAKNFQEDFVRTFRLPIQDSLAGSVLLSGQPVVLDESTPQKIKTSYLVHSLIYMPLKLRDKVIGILGVDNRHTQLPFTKRDINLLATLAEYAVIALVNADLYNETQIERKKLETVLKKIQDGVIVIDNNHKIIIINQAAEAALNLPMGDITGELYARVISQPEILELMGSKTRSLSNRTELMVEDGRVFTAMRTPIADVGTALTLHDITYLKKLDRIKNEFVTTVSHDLRSPLTAILGYTELIERAGPMNELQQEFIRRVQYSVQNITHLVDDLVNLGQIEAGFDTRKETFDLNQVFQLAIDSFKPAIEEKNNTLEVTLPNALPPFYGNPVQLRQMFEHLVDNAVKYSYPNTKISISGDMELNQVIFQIKDEGIGIPSVDLPFIFDKFYRASNLNDDKTGTGLGLAIVKSILEGHEGRIWVDSMVGKETTFTFVLPIVSP